MKSTTEIIVCDNCKEQKGYDPNTCEICQSHFCTSCAPDEDWDFPDTTVCNACHIELWERFGKLVRTMTEEFEQCPINK